MKMKKGWVFTVLVTALLALAASSVAVGGKIKLKSTAQQSASWWQWQEAYHPFFEFDDCSLGQRGDIWYLGGSAPGDPVTRVCEDPVPAGKQLFFPLFNLNWANEGSEALSVAEKRELLDGLFNESDDYFGQEFGINVEACYLSAKLDGVPVIYGGTPIERVQSPPFEWAGDPETISDGYWVLLPKLPLGEHTIQFTGALCASEGGDPILPVDVTYTLTIVE